MFESIKEFAVSYEFISLLALITYWVPLFICLSVYLFRFVGMYRADLSGCRNTHYRPSLTLGVIVWYLAISIIPIFNIFALVFDCAASVFRWLGEVLDFPLVRPKV